jgi:hypothetical protein
MNVVANIDTTPTKPPKDHFKRSSDSWKMFDVNSDTFRKFESGRCRFERWSKYLDVNDASQKEIYDYAKKNPKNTIVLRDSSSGVLRQIRRNVLK